MAKCNDTIAGIELIVKNLGAQVDTYAIVKGINFALESGIHRKIIGPFIFQTENLAQEVRPTLAEIRAFAADAKSAWTKRIWKTAWTTSIWWSLFATVIFTSFICLKFIDYYDHKMAAQIAGMARVMKFNQAAFQKMALAKVSIQVLPTTDGGGDGSPGFMLVMPGAYAADLRQVDGQNNGCIFFRSNVPEKIIRHLQPDSEDPAATNGPAK